MSDFKQAIPINIKTHVDEVPHYIVSIVYCYMLMLHSNKHLASKGGDLHVGLRSIDTY